MTSMPCRPVDDLPEAILDAAAIWHARLRDMDAETGCAPAPELHAGFHGWLRADPRHAEAFAEMERLWGKLEIPVARILAEQQAAAAGRAGPRAAPRRPGWAAAMAAALLLAIGAGLVVEGDPLVRLQSDYMTATGEEMPVTLADRSLVTLNTNSALAVDFTPVVRQVRLLKGEAWFDVLPGDARPFVVSTSAGTIRVTGTKFNVRIDGRRTMVSLAEGRVELSPSGAPGLPPVLLSPGREAMLSTVAVSSPARFDEAAVTAWRRGQMVFYNTALPDVVAVLNRYRTGRILVMGDALDHLKITGVFSTHDPDAALRAIGSTLPVKITRLSDYLVLLR